MIPTTVPIVTVFSLSKEYLVYRISTSPFPKSLNPQPSIQFVSNAAFGPIAHELDVLYTFLFATKIPSPNNPGTSIGKSVNPLI